MLNSFINPLIFAVILLPITFCYGFFVLRNARFCLNVKRQLAGDGLLYKSFGFENIAIKSGKDGDKHKLFIVNISDNNAHLVWESEDEHEIGEMELLVKDAI